MTLPEIGRTSRWHVALQVNETCTHASHEKGRTTRQRGTRWIVFFVGWIVDYSCSCVIRPFSCPLIEMFHPLLIHHHLNDDFCSLALKSDQHAILSVNFTCLSLSILLGTILALCLWQMMKIHIPRLRNNTRDLKIPGREVLGRLAEVNLHNQACARELSTHLPAVLVSSRTSFHPICRRIENVSI